MLDPLPGRCNLLCILDWGLGHAARSLALAEALEAAGETTFLASCGRAQKFLEAERPNQQVYPLPAYDVTYPTRSMPLNVALQLPGWVKTIWQEHQTTKALVQELNIDRIISDNRFGCYDPSLPSIFLTHQLHPITHNRLVSSVYRKYLQRFHTFWVPDFEEPQRRLSGQLSSAKGYQNVHFIGPLSRLTQDRLSPANTSFSDLQTLSLLSGPEPMRTQLEGILLRQLGNIPGPHVLIRGLPGHTSPLPAKCPANVEVFDFANTALLGQLIPAAQHIICRSGYSTLMDIFAITEGKSLVLIPTPGQTEQVYLAQQLALQNGSRCVLEQDKLDLAALLS
ncbi:MAG: glycosyltransferase [Bacteroidota bacterium]